jgi:hypothetical protein
MKDSLKFNLNRLVVGQCPNGKYPLDGDDMRIAQGGAEK